MDDNISKLKRKLLQMSKEELEKELQAVRKSINSKSYGLQKRLFPQDFFQLMDGHLKSYRDEIEEHLMKHKDNE